MTTPRKPSARRKRSASSKVSLAQLQQGDLERAASKDAAKKARRAQQTPRMQVFEDLLTQQQKVLDACPEVASVQLSGVLSKPDARDPAKRGALMVLPKTVLARPK